MNIYILANGYPTDIEPQFGCFEKDQALELQKNGHKITILYIDGRFRKYWRKIGISHKVDNAINIYGIYIFPIIFIEFFSYRISHLFRSILLEKLFKHVLKSQDKPDIIYAHYCYNIANAVHISKKYGIPLVGIEHWSVMNQPNLPPKAEYLGEIAYKNSDALLAVSESLATSINNRFGRLPVVVNDMVGEDFVENAVKDSVNYSSDYRYRFIAIGSLIPRKGFDILIEAYNKSGLSDKSCEVLIIGAGPEQDNLQSLISKYNLQKHVRLIGRKNKQEIISYLNGSNAFVLSSHVETFGVVCIEAMALGVPVIATICGGPEEFINDRNGILVKKNSVDDLAQAMSYIYNNKDKYNRIAIAEECRAKFSPRVIASQLTNIFNKTLNDFNSIT